MLPQYHLNRSRNLFFEMDENHDENHVVETELKK